jgi:putative DNA primase/helicase
MNGTNEMKIGSIINNAEDVCDPIEALLDESKENPGAPFIPEHLKCLIELKQNSLAEYEAVRAKLKSTGVRVLELDKAVDQAHQNDDPPVSGSLLDWPEDEPWSESVNGAQLLDEIVVSIKRHLVLPDHAAEAMALWAAYTFVHDASVISPRLAFLSPVKRCGKTTALSILQQLVPKPLPLSNISPAAVFRSIDLAAPTLLIDEADTFLRDNDDLRGILNSGHNKSLAYVIRTGGNDHIPAKFGTWAPVAIAMIGKLPDTLEDRSIVVPLKRKKPQDNVDRFRLDQTEQFEIIRQKMKRWSDDNFNSLRGWDGEIPPTLHDRAADNWRPLFAIAQTLGGHWPNTARLAAIALTVIDDEGSMGALILRDIKRLFDETEQDQLATASILSALNLMDDRPWQEWRPGKPMTAPQLSKLVRPFGVHPSTVRLSSANTAKGYKRIAFNDAFARYVVDSAVTPSQVNEPKGFRPIETVTNEIRVTDKKSSKTAVSSDCDGVTAKKPDTKITGNEIPPMPEFLKRTKPKL